MLRTQCPHQGILPSLAILRLSLLVSSRMLACVSCGIKLSILRYSLISLRQFFSTQIIHSLKAVILLYCIKFSHNKCVFTIYLNVTLIWCWHYPEILSQQCCTSLICQILFFWQKHRDCWAPEFEYPDRSCQGPIHCLSLLSIHGTHAEIGTLKLRIYSQLGILEGLGS